MQIREIAQDSPSTSNCAILFVSKNNCGTKLQMSRFVNVPTVSVLKCLSVNET